MSISDSARHLRNGFTIIEMLVVIGIIAILAAITFGLVSGVTERGRTSRAQSELRTLAQALEQYRSHYGDYPWVNVDEFSYNSDPESDRTPELVFNALAGVLGPRGHNIVDQEGSYGPSFVDFGNLTLRSDSELPDPEQTSSELDNAFVDPWGNAYRYLYKDEGNSEEWERQNFILYSMGPSGEDSAPDPDGTIPDSPENIDNLYHDE